MTVKELMENLRLDTLLREDVFWSAFRLKYEFSNTGIKYSSSLDEELFNFDVSQELIDFILISRCKDYQFKTLVRQLNKLGFNTSICNYIVGVNNLGRKNIVGSIEDGVEDLDLVLNKISNFGIGLGVSKTGEYYLSAIPFDKNRIDMGEYLLYTHQGRRMKDIMRLSGITLGSDIYEKVFTEGKIEVAKYYKSIKVRELVDTILKRTHMLIHLNKDSMEFEFYSNLRGY